MEQLLEAVVQSLQVQTSVDAAVRSKLQSCIIPDFGLLPELHSSGALSDPEIAEIKSKSNIDQRSEKLLEVVVKKNQLQKLARGLLATKQLHAVAFLGSHGVYTRDFEDVWPLSDSQIHVLSFNRNPLVKCLETTGLVFELFKKDVITTAERDFIVDKDTDRGKNESLLDILIRKSQRNYKDAIECLRSVNQGYAASILKQAVSDIGTERTLTDIADLPQTLYMLCVVKAYIRTLVTSPERHPEKGIYRALCHVSQYWHKMVSSPDFKMMYRYHVSGYFNRVLRRATVVGNNRYYLSWRITPKKFIDCLHHAECLTDDDTRFIKCQAYDHDKIDEVISVVRDLSIDKYAVYVDCLRRTEQHLSADISELGGLAIKSKSINDEGPNVEQWELKVIERINQVRNKMVPRSPELEKQIDFLKLHDIEILDGRHDRGIVTWFWVHSEEALEKIHTWRDSEEIETILEKLFEVLGTWGEPIEGHIKPDWVIVDGAQFKREVVNLPMTLYMLAELNIDATKGPAKGITGLQDKLYVLHPKSIVIYEADKPFKLLDEIQFSEFGSLTDIVASQKSLCLYVVDEGNTCIWKITLENRLLEKWLPGVGLPFTCSVSGSSGNVLVVRQGKPAFLEVFGPDAKLVHKLQLPDHFANPRHAVETRSGNYDIVDQQALIEMTKSGVVTRYHKAFHQPENQTNPLKSASHLAVDVGERIYVAESERILQFDSQLVLAQVILEKPKIRSPTRLCHIKEKKLLMVVHDGGRQVYVYNLRPVD